MESVENKSAELVVRQGEQVRRVSLDKPVFLIGREAGCDVVLDDVLVSRQHACLYRDPYGRWTLNDLHSRNGVWIEGQRIAFRVLAAGERATIGPFALSLSRAQERQIAPEGSFGAAASMAEDAVHSDIFTTRVDSEEKISSGRLRELNSIIDRLADVSNSRDLYPEACRHMARSPEEIALVLRLSRGEDQAGSPAKTLAAHRGGASDSDSVRHAAALRLSRRVIETVRATGQAVRASNVLLSDGEQLQLTITDEGRPHAVLCVPIVLTDDWADVLYLDVPVEDVGIEELDFARAVARQVGFTRKSILQVEEAARSRTLDQQLEMAREIQAGLMPKALDVSEHLDLSVMCEPAMWVGGDHCDVWKLADGRIAFVVGDVSGKGLAAAMVMANLQAALRTALDFCPDPAKAITHVSNHLEQHMPPGTFVTLFLGLLEPQDGRLEYVNAGHIQPLLAGGGKVNVLGKPRNAPLGLGDPCYVSDSAMVEPGQTILVVSDGVTEARSLQGEFYGDKRLTALLESMPFPTSAEMVSAIAGSVVAFRGPLPQQDDLTILALRRE